MDRKFPDHPEIDLLNQLANLSMEQKIDLLLRLTIKNRVDILQTKIMCEHTAAKATGIDLLAPRDNVLIFETLRYQDFDTLLDVSHAAKNPERAFDGLDGHLYGE